MLIRLTESGNETINPTSLYDAVGYNTQLCLELDRLGSIEVPVYLTGSHFFETATKDSDLDFFVGIGEHFGSVGYERVVEGNGYYYDKFTSSVFRKSYGKYKIDICVCLAPKTKASAQLLLQKMEYGEVLRDLKKSHYELVLRQKLWNATYDICYVTRRAQAIGIEEKRRESIRISDQIMEARKDLLEIRRAFDHFPSQDLIKRETELVRKLVTLGEWPTMNKTGNYSAEEMWKNYGINWHLYAQPFFCSACGGDLRDHVNGPPFKLENAEIVGDRCVTFGCPHCGHKWSR